MVERVVSQVLESHVTFLRDDLVRRVMQELQPVLEPAPDANPNNLLRAISSIHQATSQKDILNALLESTESHSGRAALFVMKSGTASGWQGRAFVSNNDSIKNFALDVSSGLAARALENHETVTGVAAELDPNFVSTFGAPAGDQAVLLPLIVKEKPVALLYADGGIQAGGPLDPAALEILALSASTWLEVVGLRRGNAAQEQLAVEKAEAASASAAVAAAAPLVQAAAAAAAIPEPQITSADQEIHKKAQRFAKLLVDEIKLYNQVKVTEGRKKKDLYDRLKDDIEKSRAIYKKRYAGTAAESADYFRDALVRILGDNDSSLLGSNFPR